MKYNYASKFLSFQYIFVIAVLILFSCKKEPASSTDNSNNAPVEVATIIPSTTKLVDANVSNDLTQLDSNQLTFQTSSFTASISIGDVLVSGVSTNAPNGFLRKITGIQIVGGQTILQTEEAALSEVFEQCKASFHKDITDADILSIDSSGMLKTAISLQTITLDKVLFDGDNDHNTTIDQVKATGTLALQPSFDIDFEVGFFSLKKLQLAANLNATSSLKITAGGSVKSTNDVKFDLCSFRLKNITITIGGIPLVICPKLVIAVGLNGQITSVVTAQVNDVYKAKAGLLYNNGTWSSIIDTANKFTYVKPTFTQNISVTGYLEPRVDFQLYDSPKVKGTIAIMGYFRGELETSPDTLWRLYGGVEANASVYVKVFDKTLANKSATVYSAEKLLAEGPEADSAAIVKYLTNGASRAWKVDPQFYTQSCCANYNALDVMTYNKNGSVSYYYGQNTGCQLTGCSKPPSTDVFAWSIKRISPKSKVFQIYWDGVAWAEISAITGSKMKITLIECCMWDGQGAGFPVEYNSF